MSKRKKKYYPKHRSCTGKRPWDKRKSAQRHLARGKQAGHYTGSHKVYYCEYCKCYHIGRS